MATLKQYVCYPKSETSVSPGDNVSERMPRAFVHADNGEKIYKNPADISAGQLFGRKSWTVCEEGSHQTHTETVVESLVARVDSLEKEAKRTNEKVLMLENNVNVLGKHFVVGVAAEVLQFLLKKQPPEVTLRSTAFAWQVTDPQGILHQMLTVINQNPISAPWTARSLAEVLDAVQQRRNTSVHFGSYWSLVESGVKPALELLSDRADLRRACPQENFILNYAEDLLKLVGET